MCSYILKINLHIGETSGKLSFPNDYSKMGDLDEDYGEEKSKGSYILLSLRIVCWSLIGRGKKLKEG